MGILFLIIASIPLYHIVYLIRRRVLTNSNKNRKEIKDIISKNPPNMEFWKLALIDNKCTIINWYLLYFINTILLLYCVFYAIYLFI